MTNQINEGLFDSLKNFLVRKYGFGGAKRRALGTRERKLLTKELVRQWSFISGKANLQATAENLGAFLSAIELDQNSINKITSEFGLKSQRKNNRLIKSPVLPRNMLGSFFNRAVELQQFNLLNNQQNQTEPQSEPEKNPEVSSDLSQQEPDPIQSEPKRSNRRITVHDVEKFISRLSPEQRSQFVVKNVLANMSAKEISDISRHLFKRQQ